MIKQWLTMYLHNEIMSFLQVKKKRPTPNTENLRFRRPGTRWYPHSVAPAVFLKTVPKEERNNQRQIAKKESWQVWTIFFLPVEVKIAGVILIKPFYVAHCIYHISFSIYSTLAWHWSLHYQMTKCGSISNKHLPLFLECLCSPPSFLQDFARKASESTCLSTSSGKNCSFYFKASSSLPPQTLWNIFFCWNMRNFVHPKSSRSPAFSWVGAALK